MRSQIFVAHGVKVINDCYNANPASMKAAIQLLAQTGVGRKKVAVLGDMLELGPAAAQMHEEVGAFVAHQGVDQLLACGGLSRSLAEGARRAGMDRARILEVPDAVSAAAAVKGLVKQGDVVLVKGSRGMKLEQVVQVLLGARRPATRAS
jgi:UDP-N-acetylmuramoyl-tripeptide--D-alanyl-D-alanine ligase